MVRKFLYFIAAIMILVIASGFALNIWSKEATEFAFVPRGEFVEQDALEANAYEDPGMWYSRPGIGVDDPARWQPATRGQERTIPAPADAAAPDFAVFFVHPTSYIPLALTADAQWNAKLGDTEAEDRARLFLRGLASPFNQADEIWAPKYRQAVVGAFLTDQEEAQLALDSAYRDVAQAFSYFRESIDADTPIILAGHSQGAVHLLRLLREEIADKPIKGRIAAAYVVGWPISLETDLPLLPLPACAAANQAGCLMSWSSYAEPADPSDLFDRYATSIGFDGTERGTSNILCTNPLTGRVGGEAAATSNLGTLVPDSDLANGELVPALVPARCSERGLLLIGDAPQMGNAVLPGNNYHVYDIPLFWNNLKADVGKRVEAWSQTR